MKESYGKVLARHAGPESYAGGGNTVGVATTGVHAGPATQSVPGSEISLDLAVPPTRANKAATAVAESAEERRLAPCRSRPTVIVPTVLRA